ncbi:alanine dehydrogenase [Allofustis seminis]|uniref:alanine dehydrogenase n=1 Tax=Allofustis seminis TaxID=166939 RepID=UPI00036A1445|nr:alanine dehydrogenase [Allofustis seminis]
MIIGLPKEIKTNENRVGMTPANVNELVELGHEVLVETQAGIGSGFTDEEYEKAGAKIISSAAEVWKAKMIVKVKEPLESEYQYFYEDQIIFTYLHLAANRTLTDALIDANVSGLAYETISVKGRLPLLNPMSEVAGRTAVQVAANLLEKHNGGSGILLGGVPGVRRARVTIIGGGVVGVNAAKIAVGMGAQVTILDINPTRLAELDNMFDSQVDTLMSNAYNIENSVKNSDVVIGAVLIAGARAPILVTEEMIKAMAPGSVVIDISVDQGGNFETTTKATTHENPTYIKHDVVHYTVANIPGAVPRTSTVALTNATMPFVKQVANQGLEKAFLRNKYIIRGMNTYKGLVTNQAVAQAHDLRYTSIYDLIRG